MEGLHRGSIWNPSVAGARCIEFERMLQDALDESKRGIHRSKTGIQVRHQRHRSTCEDVL